MPWVALPVTQGTGVQVGLQFPTFANAKQLTLVAADTCAGQQPIPVAAGSWPTYQPEGIPAHMRRSEEDIRRGNNALVCRLICFLIIVPGLIGGVVGFVRGFSEGVSESYSSE